MCVLHFRCVISICYPNGTAHSLFAEARVQLTHSALNVNTFLYFNRLIYCSKAKKTPLPPATIERKPSNAQQTNAPVSVQQEKPAPVEAPVPTLVPAPTVIVQPPPPSPPPPSSTVEPSSTAEPPSSNGSLSPNTTTFDFSIKHPLNSKWTLWYYLPEKNADWEKCQHKIHTVETVEDFWSLADHIKPPSDLMPGVDYSFFKNDIRPMWEDPQNVKGNIVHRL